MTPGEYATRADPDTGATLLSGRCAKCGGEVNEGEPCGVYFWAGDVLCTLLVPSGLFCRGCTPIGDKRYVEERF